MGSSSKKPSSSSSRRDRSRDRDRYRDRDSDLDVRDTDSDYRSSRVRNKSRSRRRGNERSDSYSYNRSRSSRDSGDTYDDGDYDGGWAGDGADSVYGRSKSNPSSGRANRGPPSSSNSWSDARASRRTTETDPSSAPPSQDQYRPPSVAPSSYSAPSSYGTDSSYGWPAGGAPAAPASASGYAAAQPMPPPTTYPPPQFPAPPTGNPYAVPPIPPSGTAATFSYAGAPTTGYPPAAIRSSSTYQSNSGPYDYVQHTVSSTSPVMGVYPSQPQAAALSQPPATPVPPSSAYPSWQYPSASPSSPAYYPPGRAGSAPPWTPSYPPGYQPLQPASQTPSDATHAPPFPGPPPPPPPPRFLSPNPPNANVAHLPPSPPYASTLPGSQPSPPSAFPPAAGQPQHSPAGITGRWAQDQHTGEWTWIMHGPETAPSVQRAVQPQPSDGGVREQWVPAVGGSWTLERGATAPTPSLAYPNPPVPPTAPGAPSFGPTGPSTPSFSHLQPASDGCSSPQAFATPHSAPVRPPYPPTLSLGYAPPTPPAASDTGPRDGSRGPRPSAPSQYSSDSTYRGDASRTSTRRRPPSDSDDDSSSEEERPKSRRSRRDSATSYGGGSSSRGGMSRAASRSGRRDTDDGDGSGRRARTQDRSDRYDRSRSRSASRGRESGDGRGVEYRSLSKGRPGRRSSASDAETRRALAAQIAREEEEILAARYARNRERRQSRGEAIEYEAAATPPSRSAPHRRMSVGDRFRQNHQPAETTAGTPARPLLAPSKASRIAAWSATVDVSDLSLDSSGTERDGPSPPLRSAMKGARARASVSGSFASGDLDEIVEPFEPLSTNRAAHFYGQWHPDRKR